MRVDDETAAVARETVRSGKPLRSCRFSRFSRIYPFGDDRVIKVYVLTDSWCGGGPHYKNPVGNAEWEFQAGSFLYSNGVRAPLMAGVVPPQAGALGIFRIDDPLRAMLIMERLRGISPEYLKGAEKKEAYRQFEEQTGIAKELGYRCTDADKDNNCLFDRESGLLYLFDFVRWAKETPQVHESRGPDSNRQPPGF